MSSYFFFLDCDANKSDILANYTEQRHLVAKTLIMRSISSSHIIAGECLILEANDNDDDAFEGAVATKGAWEGTIISDGDCVAGKLPTTTTSLLLSQVLASSPVKLLT